MIDWSRQVGRGPARSACIDAVSRFEAAFSGAVPARRDGFAHEGRAAGLVLGGDDGALDGLRATADPIEQLFLEVGAGFALGVSDGVPGSALTADGFGFARALLHPRRVVDRGQPPPCPDEWRAWVDHGVGRALWFITAGSKAPLVRLLRQVPESRREGHWRGLAIASVYTGGAPTDVTDALAAGCPQSRWWSEGQAWAAALRFDVAAATFTGMYAGIDDARTMQGQGHTPTGHGAGACTAPRSARSRCV